MSSPTPDGLALAVDEFVAGRDSARNGAPAGRPRPTATFTAAAMTLPPPQATASAGNGERRKRQPAATPPTPGRAGHDRGGQGHGFLTGVTDEPEECRQVTIPVMTTPIPHPRRTSPRRIRPRNPASRQPDAVVPAHGRRRRADGAPRTHHLPGSLPARTAATAPPASLSVTSILGGRPRPAMKTATRLRCPFPVPRSAWSGPTRVRRPGAGDGRGRAEWRRGASVANRVVSA
ncbi:MAG: hypothetical protein QOJ23_1667 [Actinomycetota bacterium]|nr:hypothetical protein [Actinomycetota bacterium]